jgi:3-hydroxybutyryl-CoA dehydrogenase
MRIAKVGVVGAGVMGAGIAQRCATFQYNVVLTDVSPAQLDSAKKRIHASLNKAGEKGQIGNYQKIEIYENIEFARGLDSVRECELVVEAVPEKAEVKQQVFRDLDRICAANAILASNTSSIPLSRLAEATQRPDKVLGIHFMNPVPLMRLVEMILAPRTSPATLDTCRKFVTDLGCEIVESRDAPGFIINRVLMPMINEAIHALREGVASAEDIDKGMTLGTNHPKGPLALADYIGLDTVLFILQSIHRELGSDRFKPCPLLEEYVRQNRLGRKTGRGFFTYP